MALCADGTVEWIFDFSPCHKSDFGMKEVIYSDQEKTEAKARLDEFWARHHGNLATSSTCDYYNQWATNYDKDLDILGYKGPAIAADHFAKHAKQIGFGKDVRILDVAAGTGKAGEKELPVLKNAYTNVIKGQFVPYKYIHKGKLLNDHGFWNIEANDVNETMLGVAKTKGVYRQFHVGKFQDIALPEGSFGAAVMVGYSSLRDLEPVARLIRRGGLFVTSLRAEVRPKEQKYADEMEKTGVWECLEHMEYPQQYHLDDDALVFVYKIL